MPKTLGGLFGLVLTSVITVAIGLYIINRVTVVRNIVYGQKAA